MDAKTSRDKRQPKTSASHIIVVIWKALRTIKRQMDSDLQRCGMSNTDFRVLEVLLRTRVRYR